MPSSNLQKLKARVLEEGLLVLKCSGKLVEGPAVRSAALLKKSGKLKNLVIVPGAQAQITATMEKRGLRPRFDGEGCRITDEPAMRIATSEIGKVVFGIVKSLHDCGVDASFKHFGMFYGKPAGSGNRTGVITGMSCGEVALELLCGRAMVLAPLGEDSEGGPLSLNADPAAASAAVALGATHLVIAMEKDGIEVGGSQLKSVTIPALAGLIGDGTFSGGMVVKAKACIYAAKAGIPVSLVDGNDPDALERVLGGKGCGTAVVR